MNEEKRERTRGPWQVIEDRHPHYLGGEHIERRIVTTWIHGQLKAPASVVNMSWGVPAKKGEAALPMIHISAEDARFIAVAPATFDALNAALGYMLNAKIDLETGAPKRTALATIDGGIKLIRAALANATDASATICPNGEAVREHPLSNPKSMREI